MIEESHRAMTRSILNTYRSATPEQIEYGLGWYDDAFTRCESIGWRTGHTATQAVVALAHLSPRTHWAKNLELLDELLHGEPAPGWALKRSWRLASASLLAEDPLLTFSRRANKTRHFAHAILGDRQAVCVDTWSARVAGVEQDRIRGQQVYNRVVDAYRRGARRVGLAPRDLQSITWVVARDGHR